MRFSYRLSILAASRVDCVQFNMSLNATVKSIGSILAYKSHLYMRSIPYPYFILNCRVSKNAMTYVKFYAPSAFNLGVDTGG
jgi:hypothetical protein